MWRKWDLGVLIMNVNLKAAPLHVLGGVHAQVITTYLKSARSASPRLGQLAPYLLLDMPDMRLSQMRYSSARDSLAQRSAEELFKIADVDESGKIDFSEFTKLHALMKGVLTADYKKEEALMMNAARNKRRLKLTVCLLAVTAAFFVLSTLANATAMYVIVDSQVTTTANPSSGELTTKEGNEVSTRQGGREVRRPLTSP